ncbi:MAG TPA: CAP domain-containing protein [Microvirga sp.]|nr:CAP domain-containing protein [Microvirga sp.]
MLELVNRARAQAGVQPLAFDGDLNESAHKHSKWMIDTDTFSHTGVNNTQPHARMESAGYSFTGAWASGENIAWASTRSPTGYADEIELLHSNLMNSPPHRANILSANFREIGIGFNTGSYKNYDAAFVTQNFARSGTNPFITGVAFDDKDGDRFYDVGEGLRGLAVKAVGTTGSIFTATTYKSGGYDLQVPAGTYTVTISGPGIVAAVKVVTVATQNVKFDVVDPVQVGGATTTARAGATATASETSSREKEASGTLSESTEAEQFEFALSESRPGEADPLADLRDGSAGDLDLAHGIGRDGGFLAALVKLLWTDGRHHGFEGWGEHPADGRHHGFGGWGEHRDGRLDGATPADLIV